jgi:hypothetical protein
MAGMQNSHAQPSQSSLLNPLYRLSIDAQSTTTRRPEGVAIKHYIIDDSNTTYLVCLSIGVMVSLLFTPILACLLLVCANATPKHKKGFLVGIGSGWFLWGVGFLVVGAIFSNIGARFSYIIGIGLGFLIPSFIFMGISMFMFYLAQRDPWNGTWHSPGSQTYVPPAVKGLPAPPPPPAQRAYASPPQTYPQPMMYEPPNPSTY